MSRLALFGTNDAISSSNFSQGTSENWTLIDSGALDLPTARLTMGPTVAVDNMTAYKSYRIIFPTLKNTLAADSMQIGEIQFFGSAVPTTAVPEPGAIGMSTPCTIAIIAWLRRKNGVI
jgi:hypothetical protein